MGQSPEWLFPAAIGAPSPAPMAGRADYGRSRGCNAGLVELAATRYRWPWAGCGPAA